MTSIFSDGLKPPSSCKLRKVRPRDQAFFTSMQRLFTLTMIYYSRVEIETNFSLHFLVFRIMFPNKVHVFSTFSGFGQVQTNHSTQFFTIPSSNYGYGIHEEFRCAKKKGPKIGFRIANGSLMKELVIVWKQRTFNSTTWR